MDSQSKNQVCGERLDMTGEDQTVASDQSNGTLKFKSPIYDADDSGYSELGVHAELSDEHRLRKRRRSCDDGSSEVEGFGAPCLGSSTPCQNDRSTHDQKYVQSPTFDNGGEVLEIDLRRKHVDTAARRGGFMVASPPLNEYTGSRPTVGLTSPNSRPWFMDGLLTSPIGKSWFETFDAASSGKASKITGTPAESKKPAIELKDDGNENIKTGENIRHLHGVNFHKGTRNEINQSSNCFSHEERVIRINSKTYTCGDACSTDQEKVSGIFTGGKEINRSSDSPTLVHVQESKDGNNNVVVISKRGNVSPHAIDLQGQKEISHTGSPENIGKLTRVHDNHAKTDETLEQNDILKGRPTVKDYIGINKNRHQSLSDSNVSEDEHYSSDREEKLDQSDETDTASDADDNGKHSASSPEKIPNDETVSTPKHSTRNRRKMTTPRRGADKSDPTFRGVTMWFRTDFKDGDSDLQISACYSNVKAGCSPNPYPLCPSDPSLQDPYCFSETEGNSPYHNIKMCASCRTRRTPLWRDAEDGTPLCNACGIRYKKYRLRCSKCWHIPKKDIQTYPNCPVCGASLRYSFHNRKTW